MEGEVGQRTVAVLIIGVAASHSVRGAVFVAFAAIIVATNLALGGTINLINTVRMLLASVLVMVVVVAVAGIGVGVVVIMSVLAMSLSVRMTVISMRMAVAVIVRTSFLVIVVVVDSRGTTARRSVLLGAARTAVDAHGGKRYKSELW